jgi:hypothetical protein
MMAAASGVSGDARVVNAEQATFECIFGRGCDGICCRNGRPPVYADEAARIEANLAAFLPELRPAARRVVEAVGFLSRRRKAGQPTLRVAEGWCVFFNRGCVLHKVGAARGDKFRYKPAVCALFPIAKDRHDRWYVRQKGLNGEIWDLFCLDPQASPVRAVDSIADEIALAQGYSREERGE